jgi:hypothetical protein
MPPNVESGSEEEEIGVNDIDNILRDDDGDGDMEESESVDDLEDDSEAEFGYKDAADIGGSDDNQGERDEDEDYDSDQL